MPENLNTSPTLITGSSGFLGWNLLQTAPRKIDILAQYQNNQPCLIANQKGLQLDLSKNNTLKTLNKLKFSAIVYAAAYSDISTCQQDPRGSKTVNLDLPLYLSEVCFQTNTPFVYYSTDLIFDGRQGNYSENTRPNPLSLYGEQKAEAELKILNHNPHALILRCPLMYGEANPHRPATLQNTLSLLQKGQTQTLFTDEYRSAVRALRVAQFTWKKLGKLNGLYNVGGEQALSRHQMGVQLAKVYQIKHPAIQAIRQSDLPELGPRPANCTLNSQKARDQGFISLNYFDELQHIKEIAHDQT